MKLLIVLVTVIAVFTVDGWDFSRESEIHDTENEDQLYPKEFENQVKSQHFLDGSDGNNLEEIYDPAEKAHLLKEKSLLVADGHEESDSAYDAYQITDRNLYLEGTKEQPKGKLRRSICKARKACVAMGGFCVTNATLCSGRLVPEGCKGVNCQCCVLDTIEAKFDNLEEELQSLKENVNSELQSLKVNMNTSNTNVNSKLQSLKADTDNMNSTLNSKLDLLANNQGTIEAKLDNLEDELQSLKENMNSELQSLKVDTNNMNSTLNSKLDSILKGQDISLKNVDFTSIEGEAGATSFYGDCCTAYKGFDGPEWHSGVSTMPQALWFHLDQPIKVVMYSFKSRTAHGENLKADGPSKYEFFGSNGTECSDQSSWVVLKKDYSGMPFTPEYQQRTEYVPHPDFYTCYGFKIIDVPGRFNGNKWAVITNINWVMSYIPDIV